VAAALALVADSGRRDKLDARYLGYHLRKAYRLVRRKAGSRLFVDLTREPGRTFMVAGAARSGTTWLGEIIAAQLPCRIMFEPFHPEYAPAMRRHHLFHYLRPEQQDAELHAYAAKLFAGKVRNGWIDRQNERLISKYRVIKEIRANLFLRWLSERFPEVPLIFIVRHPCAVVLSRMELGWATDSDIAPLLAQDALQADHLAPYMDAIADARSDEEKHAVIWSINNLVPLAQFRPGELTVVSYEHLCVQPETEARRVFAAMGQAYRSPGEGQIRRPSITARASSAVVTGQDMIGRWRDHLSTGQIDRVLRVVERFGLGHLYADGPMPLAAGMALWTAAASRKGVGQWAPQSEPGVA
jgi:hypothetical protein